MTAPQYPPAGGYPAEPRPPDRAPGTHSRPPQGTGRHEEVSLGQLVGDFARDLSTLVRQEFALARAEFKR